MAPATAPLALQPIRRQASGQPPPRPPGALSTHVHSKWQDFVPVFVCVLLVWRTSVVLLDALRSTHASATGRRAHPGPAVNVVTAPRTVCFLFHGNSHDELLLQQCMPHCTTHVA